MNVKDRVRGVSFIQWVVISGKLKVLHCPLVTYNYPLNKKNLNERF